MVAEAPGRRGCPCVSMRKISAPGAIRTHGPRIRKEMQFVTLPYSARSNPRSIYPTQGRLRVRVGWNGMGTRTHYGHTSGAQAARMPLQISADSDAEPHDPAIDPA